MIREFIDRDKERVLLEREWQSSGGRLVILYGRRRIGKTRLIDEFIRDKPGILYIAEDASPHIQISQLKVRCAEFFLGSPSRRAGHQDMGSALYLSRTKTT